MYVCMYVCVCVCVCQDLKVGGIDFWIFQLEILKSADQLRSKILDPIHMLSDQ